jgi:hypothetical protein
MRRGKGRGALGQGAFMAGGHAGRKRQNWEGAQTARGRSICHVVLRPVVKNLNSNQMVQMISKWFKLGLVQTVPS